MITLSKPKLYSRHLLKPIYHKNRVDAYHASSFPNYIHQNKNSTLNSLLCGNISRRNDKITLNNTIISSYLSTIPVSSYDKSQRVDYRVNESNQDANQHHPLSSPADNHHHILTLPSLNSKLHLDLVSTIKHIPTRVQEIIDKATTEDHMMFDNDIKAVNEHSGLFIRQLQIEEEQQNEAVESYRQAVDKLLQAGKGTGIKHIQRIVLKWYEPLCKSIEAEINLVKEKKSGNNRISYGPILFLLPIDKLAVITIDTALTFILRCGNDGAGITSLAYAIGNLIETEVNLMKLKNGKNKELDRYDSQTVAKAIADRKFAMTIHHRIRQILNEDAWSMKMKVQIGAVLLELLLSKAKCHDDVTNAMMHSIEYVPYKRKKVGMLRMDAMLYKDIVSKDNNQILPRYLPLLVQPREWDMKKKSFGGVYYRLRTEVMRTFSAGHIDTLSRANMKSVLDGLNYLGKLSWKINRPILAIIQEIWQRKIVLGEIPPHDDIPYPEYHEGNYDDHHHQNDDDPVMKRIRRRNAELHSLRCDFRLKVQIAEKFQDDIIYFPWNLDFRGRAYPIPQNLSHLGSDMCRGLLKFAEGKMLGKDGLSWLKIHIANLYGNNKISLAARVVWIDDHMVDIRDSARNPIDGRRWWTHADEPFQCLAACMELVSAIESKCPEQYICNLPVHQDGSCNGLQHYAALGRDAVGGYAVNLLPSESGPQDVYSKVLDIVLAKIDRDCALLDRIDASKASATSDTPSSTTPPDDAVSGLSHPQHAPIHARFVKGHVNRKVIKQTVMTSVYGVTAIGARAQVQSKLHDRFASDPSIISTPELETQLFHAAGYVAKLTLESLTEMFSSAQAIKTWLATSARLVASQGHVMSWITPLGLPVMQPYRRAASFQISASLQRITLTNNDDNLPVLKGKQGTAFSPNFVHSLDASHMLMTALKMKDKNLSFTAVHDSYWTHACDIPIMNELLRESFVELYKRPVLEDLYESLRIRYPDVEFPDLPGRGELDIHEVKNSKYFFH